MQNNVKSVLESLNLTAWTRISIRRHGNNGVEYLGGGHVKKVVNRYGDLVVVDSSIIDNILVIHVD